MTRISPTRVAVLLVLTLALLLSAQPAFAAAPNPTVSGTLLGSDGLPIADGQVAVNHQVKGVWKPVLTLPTSASGGWTFTLKPDSYRLDFSAPNADADSRLITTVKGANQTVNVTLQSYGSLGGTIADQGTGATLANASVDLYLRNADGTWPSTSAYSAVTGGSGSYSFAHLPCGVYAVKAASSGYFDGFYGGGSSPDTAGTLTLTRGGNPDASISLSPVPVGPSTIRGHLSQGITQWSVVGAAVMVFKQKADGTWPTSFTPGNEYQTVYTDPSGNYVTTTPLVVGNYKVRFFSIHGSFAAEWYDHVYTIGEATTLTVGYAGQSYSGIDGWVNRTAP